MTVNTKSELMDHLHHKIVIAYYGNKTDPDSVTVECQDCSTILFEPEVRVHPIELKNQHNHDFTECCECGSKNHCCCDCPTFGGPPDGSPQVNKPRSE